MDSADDDFGELYVDAKVQASALVTGGVGFVNSSGEPERIAIPDNNRACEATSKPESLGEMKNFAVVAKDSSPCAVNLTETDVESEFSDSDDDLNIVLKDEDSKALPVARAVADAVEASKPCSFQKPWTGNRCTVPNGGMVNGRSSVDASANNVWIDPSLGRPQCGYSFSHSWSRTSIDVFEKKPWRNPGSQVNEFFNYGFNEQSWKDYCKPLGRAIEVGGGTLERIPSADLRRPRDSDPDVVIEIPVTNDVEELSGKTPVDARSPSITSNEESRSQDLHSDHVNDFSSSGDSMKKEAFVGCQDENTRSFRGEQSPSKENYSREVTPCNKEVSKEEKEETCWNSDEVDPTSAERESSPGDHIHFSTNSSHSLGRDEESEDSETESSKGGATDDQRERSTPPRRTRFEEHEAISIKSGKRNGIKHDRHRRSHEEPSTIHSGRADYGDHRRVKQETVKDASSTPDPAFGKKVCSRDRSLYRDLSKNWQNRPLPHSNREKRHGRLYPSVDLDQDRDHRFGWRNNKESSHGRAFNHSNGYKYEARREENNSRSYFNLSQRNFRSSFKEKEDRYGRQHCEREYGLERSPDRAYERNKERNQYDWLGESYYRDHIPITDMDYRHQSEYSSSHGRHNSKHSHENDLHSRRRDDYDYNSPRRRYEDGVQREESGIPFELAYRERHSFAEVGRREFQGYERNQEFSEIDRRHHYGSDWHCDRFVSEKDDYKYRSQDAWPSPSLSLRDSWYIKGPRGASWRDDTRDFTTAEAYYSQTTQLSTGAPRDGWTRDLVHNDYVSIQDRLTYGDDWVRRDRERYELADDIQCSMREVTHPEHLSYIDETLVCDVRTPIHNRISTKQRSGYSKNHIHEIDERHHGSKKLRRDGHAFIKCQDPVDRTGGQGKLPNQPKRRFCSGEDTTDKQDHQKPSKVICRNNEKAVQIRDLIDKEEGEIIEEATNEKRIEIDKERIQESLKKMEKRRERFQKTESLRTVVATFESQTEPGVNTDDTNQQRPVRKRRWCAS